MTAYQIMSRKAHMRTFCRAHGIKIVGASFYTMWAHWGAASVETLKKIQVYLRMKPTGVWDAALQKALFPPNPNAVQSPSWWALWFYHWNLKHHDIHYAEIRPIDYDIPPGTLDCSGFVTTCNKRARRPDPNGLNYNGYGNTDSLLQHGGNVPVSDAKADDLVFYGHPVGHVAMCIGDGMVVSHGKPGDPRIAHIFYRNDLNQVRRY